MLVIFPDLYPVQLAWHFPGATLWLREQSSSAGSSEVAPNVGHVRDPDNLFGSLPLLLLFPSMAYAVDVQHG